MNHFVALAAANALLLFNPAVASAQTNGCAADLDGDGIVSGSDLAAVLNGWGACSRCVADVNGDQVIDGIDLATVLTRWASTCAPTTTAMSTAAGPLAGGTSVVITGDRLLAPTGVTFGGTPATILSSTRYSATVLAPSRRPGAVPVVVTTQGGSVTAGTFDYYGAPTITTVSPNSGIAAGGSVVTVSGSGFYGSPAVSFGSFASSGVTVLSPSQLTAVAPAGMPGSTVDLSVTTDSGSASFPNAITYLAVPAWATLLEAMPDPAVVTNAKLREAIVGTGHAWRIRDKGTGIEMLLIPPGTFDMGCSPSSLYPCLEAEYPVHTVTLTGAFYLGRHEVTQQQWTSRMGSNPSYFQHASAEVPPGEIPARPVEQVTWTSIQGFLASTGMRLPTEAEWEYAYRAGTTTAYHGFPGQIDGTDDDGLIAGIAWCLSNSLNQTRPVGGKPANGFGLNDMSGNVYERVSDWSGSYPSEPQTDPTGPATGTFRVLRGGSIFDSSDSLRSSLRVVAAEPEAVYMIFGFRVARNP